MIPKIVTSRWAAAAAAVVALAAAGCSGEPGAAGSAGVQGDVGPEGPAGQPGAKGDQGPVGDAGATGAQGAKGDKGDPGAAGANGAQGVQGPQGVTGTTGEKGDKGDKGDPGTAGAAGTAGAKGDQGISSGTLVVRVVDANTFAPIAGAKVTGLLGSTLAGSTDTAGYFQATVQTGVYQVTASAAKLNVVGVKVLTTTTSVKADSDAVSVLAGGKGVVTVKLARLSMGTLNLTSVHKAGTAIYTDSNCVACHSDRKGDYSADPKFPAFHAIKAHSDSSCTMCHAKTEVNLGNWQGNGTPVARKQVDASKACKVCHKNYPTKLP